MTLTTLPPVLESAVEKMAKTSWERQVLIRPIPPAWSWDEVPATHKANSCDFAREKMLDVLNALLADGKARISEVQHRDRSKPPGRRIIIPLSEPLP